MKVTDLRRKLMAALAAGGMMAPSAARAANVDTNLVVNGNFETVDAASPLVAAQTAYNSPLILNWTANPATSLAFAYSHNQTGNVPDFANGGPLSIGGNYYFTPQANNLADVDTNIDAIGEYSQDIAVGTGATGTAIAAGTAVYSLNGFFSSYANHRDYGNVHVEFLNGSSASLGTTQISGNGSTNQWQGRLATGPVPAGTATVRVSIYGTALTSGPDGYIDNVDFRIGAAPHASVLELQVNRNSGAASLVNRTGAAVDLEGYEITSAFQALSPANWLSIADQYDSGNPGVNQVDPAHVWTELTLPASRSDLSEGDLSSGDGALVPNGRTINLGTTSTWLATPTEDLYFSYTSNGQVVPGIVTYLGNGGQPLKAGDLNADGSVNSADWVIVRTNQHSTTLAGLSLAEAYRRGDFNQDKLNNHADFVAFKSAFDAANGVGAFVAMVQSTPEASSLALAFAAGVGLAPAARRRRLKGQLS